MTTYKATLTGRQRQNLLVLLKRTPLKGEEAEEFMQIVAAITQAKPDSAPTFKPDRPAPATPPETRNSKLETTP